ncbi:FHA domain-containing protein [bacterium]|nr:FHA domain-containing protein [bacterium]
MSEHNKTPDPNRVLKTDETSDPVDTSKQFARIKGSLLPVLLVLRGASPKPFHVLATKENTVGRGDDNTILLDDAGCSRTHFALIYENAAHPDKVPSVYIEDRASRNGTLLNGSRLKEATRLKFGDRIQAGNTIMCFVIRTVGEVEAETARQSEPPSPDDLQNTRVAVHCGAVLKLNLPDQTGTPMRLEGTLEDVSLTSMRFRSIEPPKPEYLDALRPMRTARIHAELPGQDAPLDASGRIAWIHRDASGCVMLGLEIHGITPTSQDTLTRYIVSNS